MRKWEAIVAAFMEGRADELCSIKLRMHAFDNPDFLLDNGTWVEATLSENTAYAKLFQHGHQAPHLMVVWLDEDPGFHKRTCAKVPFPNAEVMNVTSLYARMRTSKGGEDLIAKIDLLKTLKGVLMQNERGSG